MDDKDLRLLSDLINFRLNLAFRVLCSLLQPCRHLSTSPSPKLQPHRLVSVPNPPSVPTTLPLSLPLPFPPHLTDLPLKLHPAFRDHLEAFCQTQSELISASSVLPATRCVLVSVTVAQVP